MDDSLLVSRLERLRDLTGDRQGFLERQARTAGTAFPRQPQDRLSRDLDRHVATKLQVTSAIDLAMPPAPSSSTTS